MATKPALEDNRVTPAATVRSVVAPQGLPVANPTPPQVNTPTPDDPIQKFSVHGIKTRVIWRLKEKAVAQHRTISEVVAEALDQWLERNGGRP